MRPANDAITRDLVLAHRARTARVGWAVAAIVLGVSAFGAFVAAAIAWLVSHLAGAIVFPIVLIFAAFAIVARTRAKASAAEAKRALDAAWAGAAAQIVAAHGGETTAAELARTMHLSEPEAEAILSTLSSTDRARIDVGDDAELHYRVPPEGETAMDEGASETRNARRS